MNPPQSEIPLDEIAQHYPDQWVLVEETRWNAQSYPTHGIVCAASTQRRELRATLHACHQLAQVKTFIFYTGDKISTHLTVVL
jgi:hypothetical protein